MNSKQIGIGVAVIAALLIVGLFFVPHFINSLSGGTPSNEDETNMDTANGSDDATGGGLQMQDEAVGTGTEATVGSTVTVNYTGKLTNGTVFDSSASHGQAFTFTLGQGQVIQGWELGIQGMKVGGKRILVIPSSLAYGAQAIQGRDASGNVVDVIPANSTLVFEVELLNVQNSGAQAQ